MKNPYAKKAGVKLLIETLETYSPKTNFYHG